MNDEEMHTYQNSSMINTAFKVGSVSSSDRKVPKVSELSKLRVSIFVPKQHGMQLYVEQIA